MKGPNVPMCKGACGFVFPIPTLPEELMVICWFELVKSPMVWLVGAEMKTPYGEVVCWTVLNPKTELVAMLPRTSRADPGDVVPIPTSLELLMVSCWLKLVKSPMVWLVGADMKTPYGEVDCWTLLNPKTEF